MNGKANKKKKFICFMPLKKKKKKKTVKTARKVSRISTTIGTHNYVPLNNDFQWKSKYNYYTCLLIIC